ncbi:MAG: RND family transporter [Rubripirellula sp.]
MDRGPLLERRSPVGLSYALLILMAFFFVLPGGFRAARLSLGQKENDVKDWLPSDFPETAELEWFGDHFAGESFVLATWPGCTSGDQRLKLLQQKLLHESDSYDPSADFPLELAEAYTRAKQVGNELELLDTGNNFLNWGGQNEKWLSTAAGKWYYITPNGRLYRWEESSNGPAAAIRSIKKKLGSYELNGQFVTAFGNEPAAGAANPFYNDPSMLCAPLFHSVQTGDSIVDELACEGGSLWPRDFIEESRREVVARRRAMERLTGSLFAPAVDQDFAWSAEAFREAIPEDRRDSLPEDFDAMVEASLGQLVDDRFDGSLDALKNANLNQRTDVWHAVYDSAAVEPPPRLTCILVTLTEVAKDNLSYALGRGVLGQPRGRLLQLAAESGVRPASAPSMAPPPFNKKDPESVAGMPPLRMGGPPVDNMAIDEEGTITLVRLVGYSVLLGIVLSYLCFGSIKITIMVFVVGGTSAMISMAMVWWTSGRVDAILMSMPSLVYVLGLSGAIHVVNYYRDEVRARGFEGAAGRALKHAFLPCTLASLTTAIGLVSLFTSNLAPISNFGLYSAIGVIMTLAVLFSYLPAALQTFAPAIDRDTKVEADAPKESALSDWWAGVGRWIAGHHALVSVSCMVVLVIGSFGLLNIKTSVQLLKLFDSDSRIIHDYAWLEDNFGKLVPMELIVRVPPSMQSEYIASTSLDGEDENRLADVDSEKQSHSAVQSLDVLERVEVVSRIRTVVQRVFGESGRGVVGQATSADTFLPPLPDVSNGYTSQRSIYNKELLASSAELRDNDYLRIEKSGPYADSELWRVSLRVAALSDVDYGYFITTLREAVEPVLRAYDTRDELLKILVDPATGKLKPKQRVLVVGSRRPRSLEKTELIDDAGAIQADATYMATLGELLGVERMQKPEWLEVPIETAQKLTSDAKDWERKIQHFDAVVWLGSEGFKRQDFDMAKRFVDGQEIRSKVIKPILVGDRIPDVEGSGPMQVIYTGVVPVVYKAQRTLLSSLANSIGLAFVLIAGVMVLLLNPGKPGFGWLVPDHFANGLAAGLVAMLPNVFPVLLVFGVMCHLGIEIDIGTMMTASVAMGVAVDDTIHFLSWFRTHLDRGMDRVEAVIETYRRVGPAMTQTTIVGGLGLFVFALSTFTPTQRFGTLMLVMLATALIGDLVFLPALLAGPLGRWFKPRVNAKRDQPSPGGSTSKLAESQEPQTTESNHTRADQASAQQPPDSEPSIPHLRVHFPDRADKPHRVKRK